MNSSGEKHDESSQTSLNTTQLPGDVQGLHAPQSENAARSPPSASGSSSEQRHYSTRSSRTAGGDPTMSGYLISSNKYNFAPKMGSDGRVAQACIRCRNSKIKCDSGHPCSRCIAHKCPEMCVYSEARQRGRKRATVEPVKPAKAPKRAAQQNMAAALHQAAQVHLNMHSSVSMAEQPHAQLYSLHHQQQHNRNAPQAGGNLSLSQRAATGSYAQSLFSPAQTQPLSQQGLSQSLFTSRAAAQPAASTRLTQLSPPNAPPRSHTLSLLSQAQPAASPAGDAGRAPADASRGMSSSLARGMGLSSLSPAQGGLMTRQQYGSAPQSSSMFPLGPYTHTHTHASPAKEHAFFPAHVTPPSRAHTGTTPPSAGPAAEPQQHMHLALPASASSGSTLPTFLSNSTNATNVTNAPPSPAAGPVTLPAAPACYPAPAAVPAGSPLAAAFAACPRHLWPECSCHQHPSRATSPSNATPPPCGYCLMVAAPHDTDPALAAAHPLLAAAIARGPSGLPAHAPLLLRYALHATAALCRDLREHAAADHARAPFAAAVPRRIDTMLSYLCLPPAPDAADCPDAPPTQDPASGSLSQHVVHLMEPGVAAYSYTFVPKAGAPAPAPAEAPVKQEPGVKAEPRDGATDTAAAAASPVSPRWFSNPEFLRLIGYSSDDARARGIADAASPSLVDLLLAATRACFDGVPCFLRRSVWSHKAGHPVFTLDTVSLILPPASAAGHVAMSMYVRSVADPDPCERDPSHFLPACPIGLRINKLLTVAPTHVHSHAFSATSASALAKPFRNLIALALAGLPHRSPMVCQVFPALYAPCDRLGLKLPLVPPPPAQLESSPVLLTAWLIHHLDPASTADAEANDSNSNAAADANANAKPAAVPSAVELLLSRAVTLDDTALLRAALSASNTCVIGIDHALPMPLHTRTHANALDQPADASTAARSLSLAFEQARSASAALASAPAAQPAAYRDTGSATARTSAVAALRAGPVELVYPFHLKENQPPTPAPTPAADKTSPSSGPASPVPVLAHNPTAASSILLGLLSSYPWLLEAAAASPALIPTLRHSPELSRALYDLLQRSPAVAALPHDVAANVVLLLDHPALLHHLAGASSTPDSLAPALGLLPQMLSSRAIRVILQQNVAAFDTLVRNPALVEEIQQQEQAGGML